MQISIGCQLPFAYQTGKLRSAKICQATREVQLLESAVALLPPGHERLGPASPGSAARAARRCGCELACGKGPGRMQFPDVTGHLFFAAPIGNDLI